MHPTQIKNHTKSHPWTARTESGDAGIVGRIVGKIADDYFKLRRNDISLTMLVRTPKFYLNQFKSNFGRTYYMTLYYYTFYFLKSIKAGNDHYRGHIMERNWFSNKRCQRNITWPTSARVSNWFCIGQYEIDPGNINSKPLSVAQSITWIFAK